MATKPKRPQFVTPSGTFKFPALSKPDYGNEKFPKPDGEFKTGLVVALTEEVQAFIDKLMPIHAEAIEEGRKEFAKLPIATRKKLGELKEQMFYEEEYAGDEGEEQPTGNVIFKAKTKYKITDKKTKEVRFNKIGLVDAKGKPLPAGTLIYGGTTGKLSVQPSAYFIAGQGMAGISLRLVGAQILDLVGPGARSASSMGFGEEEGYEAGDEEVTGGDPEGEGEAPANGNPRDF